MTGKTSVVVIGGGYSGVMAASRLTQRDDVAVTLINPRPRFVDRIRLHQRVAGTHDALVEYADVLHEQVALTVDTVVEINRTERRLTLAGGSTIAYDYLVYAVGSGATTAGTPGAAEFGFPIASLEDVERLRDALEATADSAPVTVVGAGPAGIEMASELAEGSRRAGTGRRVTLICGGPLGRSLHPRGRRSVQRHLRRLGVTVIDGPGSEATEVSATAVHLGRGDRIPSAVTIWTAGFSVPDLAARSGLRTDAAGRMLTDETLTSLDDDHIVATGDAAAPSDRPYRMSCQAAVQLGPQAADSVLSRLEGRRPAPVTAGFGGLCISLGRRAGIFQFTHADDVAKSYHIGGVAGAVVKELVCRSIVSQQIGHEARRPGARLWRGKDPDRSTGPAAGRNARASEEAG